MKLLLELSMECEPLAHAEAMAAAEAVGGGVSLSYSEPGVLIVDTTADPRELASRLALCHFVSEWLCSCPRDEVVSCAREIAVEGPIRVRSTKVGVSSTDLAGATRRVGAVVGEGRGVDLHRPRSDLRLVFSKRAHFGRVIAAIDRPSFEKRKNRYMPFVYPASLHPKFARALVNLARVPPCGRLLDPFCGTGAIVAEASLLGLEAAGTDLAEKMVVGARKNLEHLGAKAELCRCDVGEIGRCVGRVDGIATDPPYGRSTSTEGESIPSLYGRAFKAFAEVLEPGSKVAVVVPRPSLLKGADEFQIEEHHKLWVHRSLTRHFCVLVRV